MNKFSDLSAESESDAMAHVDFRETEPERGTIAPGPVPLSKTSRAVAIKILEALHNGRVFEKGTAILTPYGRAISDAVKNS
jgi:hypothetical protein